MQNDIQVLEKDESAFVLQGKVQILIQLES